MVDIIPKAPKQHSPLSRIVFALSIAAFAAALGGYGILWFLQGRAADRLVRVETLLGEARTEEQAALEAGVFASRMRLEDFASVGMERKNFLPAFTFLETTVHPNVYFPAVSVNAARRALDVRGRASSFGMLDEQVAILKARKEPSSVSLTSLRLSETGGVDFQMSVQFPSSFFQR